MTWVMEPMTSWPEGSVGRTLVSAASAPSSEVAALLELELDEVEPVQ